LQYSCAHVSYKPEKFCAFRDENPKPTVALDYTFGRRAKGHNMVTFAFFISPLSFKIIKPS
jgi:hypothetical protein